MLLVFVVKRILSGKALAAVALQKPAASALPLTVETDSIIAGQNLAQDPLSDFIQSKSKIPLLTSFLNLAKQ